MTVNVYVVVLVGETLTEMPLVTLILPGVITPVPFTKILVKLTEPPTVMFELSVERLVMAGAAPTATVADDVTDVPAKFVTVSVYVVEDVGETVTGVPLVTAMLPGVITPVPFEKMAVRLAELPVVMDVGLAMKLLIVGAGSTATVVVWVTDVPSGFVTVSV